MPSHNRLYQGYDDAWPNFGSPPPIGEIHCRNVIYLFSKLMTINWVVAAATLRSRQIFD